MKYDDLYCNPLPLPDYPMGIFALSRNPGGKVAAQNFMGPPADYRELADPEVLYDGGKWYLFPSCRQVYVSEDLIHWRYVPMQFAPDDQIGYAPTVVRCGKRILITSSPPWFNGKPQPGRIYAAPAPEGPYVCTGDVKRPDGTAIGPDFLDPALFCDDDGRLYCYWCSVPNSGFTLTTGDHWVMELDPANPSQGLCDPIRTYGFQGARPFEYFGANNEYPDHGWLEGDSLFKHNGEYYLVYSGCGTQFRTYVLGVMRSKSPLGPFVRQQEPLLLRTSGLVHGTGHGGWVQGPNGSVWQFYTCVIRRKHKFERRVAMDKVEFGPDGSAHVTATDVPQSLAHGDAGLLPLGVEQEVCASSSAENAFPAFAVDDCTHTWWEPAESDEEPWIEINLNSTFAISALRILWAEPNLDYAGGIAPVPARYRIDFCDAAGQSVATIDRTGNTEEKLIEFLQFPEVRASKVRLTIERNYAPLRRGVTALTPFGTQLAPAEK